MLRFSDGEQFNTGGKLRIEKRADGLYVVGRGMLIAVASEEEGEEWIENLRTGDANRPLRREPIND